ncbi:MAG TPA: hypothetical protein DCZ01_05340 [Elusimicrobia bacterium]|nr:hypothetical protein [Elusimicrobiota bacterium]
MTRRFHSFLASQLEAYLELKQKLGYTSYAEQAFYIARDFDYYLTFHAIVTLKQIDEGLIAAWVHAIPQRSAITKNRRLLFVQGWFDYLIRIGAADTNPARRIPSLKVKPYKPYIYTLKELQLILVEAGRCTHDRRHLLLNQTMETLLFLIYACGLRLGEARNLKIQDVDFEENTLALWRTKFHKERLVPFSPAVARELKAYLALRVQRYPPSSPEAPFFCHATGKYCGGPIEVHFRKLLVRCGLAKPKGRGAPRIHDVRHAFAVHRLYKWYQEGHDLLNKLPLLSTYMGHVNIEATQVYLTITRALLREGGRRFHDVFGDVAQKALKNALK